jgi:hypothetical protein
MDLTPDGRVNAHAIEKVLIAEKYYKQDALFLLRHASKAYLHAVLRALTVDYFLSPLDYDYSCPSPNRERLRAIDKKADGLFLPDGDGAERLLTIALPATLLYGLYRVLGARSMLESERSRAAVISCMLVIVAFLAAATLLVAVGDISRYRFNADPFYVILLALMATDLGDRGGSLFRRAGARFGRARAGGAVVL